jgi:RNA polymerase sigma-70 factor (ECF subfamily)
MTPSDAHIVRQVLGGDTEAFRMLVDRYHADALRYATHLLGDHAEAEDAVQDTLLRAYRYLGGYREQDQFRAWLWRILINRCRTRAGERSRRPEPRDASVITQLVDADAPAPDAELDRRFLSDELTQALSKLPPDQREAIVLHFADGLSYPEMSAVTGTGVSALKMRVHRACDRLRGLLTDVLHD